MARVRRSKNQRENRPIWERDRFWDFEEHAKLKTVIENPDADVIYIDRFIGRLAA